MKNKHFVEKETHIQRYCLKINLNLLDYIRKQTTLEYFKRFPSAVKSTNSPKIFKRKMSKANLAAKHIYVIFFSERKCKLGLIYAGVQH